MSCPPGLQGCQGMSQPKHWDGPLIGGSRGKGNWGVSTARSMGGAAAGQIDAENAGDDEHEVNHLIAAIAVPAMAEIA